jgi:uncharacterized protein YceH (UPF0502 family)
MSEDSPDVQQPAAAAPRWKPLGAIDRRVLGVLAEKAKTTPDTYPMSLNAVCSGANQKSNRDPVMQLEPDDVQESLDRLREIGAVGMVEGYGRVTKYRHYLYEWLGVEKVELSVMTELLLRGAQTEGELRGRVSRMDPISDLPALRALLTSLMGKGLVLPLTPEGRGHVVTHALYPPRELEHIKAQYSQARPPMPSAEDQPVSRPYVAERPSAASHAPAASASAAETGSVVVESLRRDVEELRAQVASLRHEMQDVSVQQQQIIDELRTLKDALGG